MKNLESTIYHEVAKSASLTGQEIENITKLKLFYFLKKLGFNYYFFGQIYNHLRLYFNLVLSIFSSNKLKYQNFK